MSLTTTSALDAAKEAKAASHVLATLPASARNEALTAIHDSLSAARDKILAANARDLELARQAAASGKLSQSLVSRLDLGKKGKWEDMLKDILNARNLDGPATLRTLLDHGFGLEKYPTKAEAKLYHQPQLRGLNNCEIPGTINGVPVNALPDTGSSIDAISEDFARKHGLEIEEAEMVPIRLPGGSTAESHGRVTGRFQFRGESRVYERSFRVLRKSVCDMVLGLSFLKISKTLSDYSHRIITSIRPCAQKGSRLFLLDESPQDHIRCTVNGVETAAFPDTGSDLILVSGDFARRNNFKVRRDAKHRRQIELIDGSLVWTDGMVLGAELSFDNASVPSARELDYYQYLEHSRGIAALMGDGKRKRGSKGKTAFICDLHVIEDLPCPIILSGEFIFQNKVFSRFKHLFVSEAPFRSPANYPQPTVGKRTTSLDECLMFIRLKKGGSSWLSRLRRPSTPAEPSQASDESSDQESIPLQSISTQREPIWQARWEMEEERRNQIQLWISSLVEPRRSEQQMVENRRREEWDSLYPRPAPAQGRAINAPVGI